MTDHLRSSQTHTSATSRKNHCAPASALFTFLVYAMLPQMESPATHLMRSHHYSCLIMLHQCSTTHTNPHHPNCHMTSSLPSAPTTQALSKSAVSWKPPTEVIKSVPWNDIHLTMSTEPNMCRLIEMIQDGFPQLPSYLPCKLHSYHQFHESLTEFDGVCLYKDCVIIPPSLRDRVLESLHSAQKSIAMTCSQAESSFFWPSRTPAITEIWVHCSSCNHTTPSQLGAPPTPMDPTHPTHPA